LIADYRAKVADAKRNAPKEELAARLGALRIEYLAALAAISTKIRQQARDRRRAALMALVARQKQERLVAAYRAAGKEVASPKSETKPHRPIRPANRIRPSRPKQ
jgi:hypothetical protein